MPTFAGYRLNCVGAIHRAAYIRVCDRSTFGRSARIMHLMDKVAIVTGGAHGMGEAAVRLFTKEGAKIVVAYLLADQAEAVAADIRAGGGEAIAVRTDVTSEPDWLALIDRTVSTYDRL